MCKSDIASVELNRSKARRSLAQRTAQAVGRHICEVLENEELAARPGLLQRIEPRVKLLAILLFSVTASLVHAPALLATLFGLALLLAAVSGVAPSSFARKVWGSAGLFAALVAAPAMFQSITPGPALLKLGPMTITVTGALGALTLVLRVVASAGIAMLIVWTMRWTDLLAALTKLRVPDVIVATLAMTQKQILSLMRTVEQIHAARESRTLVLGGAAEDRTWVTGRMAFVVQKSIKTADDVYDAMLARGYSGAVRLMPRPSTGRADWLHLGAAMAIAATLISVDRLVLDR